MFVRCMIVCYLLAFTFVQSTQGDGLMGNGNADEGEQEGAKTDIKSGEAGHLWEGGGAAKKTDLRLVQTVEVCFRLKN